MWCLGYPEAALADANLSLGDAREMGDAGGLFFSLFFGAVTHFLCGSYATTETLANELYTFADEQGAILWKSIRTAVSRMGFGGYRQSLGGSSAARPVARRIPFNGINRDEAVWIIIVG